MQLDPNGPDFAYECHRIKMSASLPPKRQRDVHLGMARAYKRHRDRLQQCMRHAVALGLVPAPTTRPPMVPETGRPEPTAAADVALVAARARQYRHRRESLMTVHRRKLQLTTRLVVYTTQQIDLPPALRLGTLMDRRLAVDMIAWSELSLQDPDCERRRIALRDRVAEWLTSYLTIGRVAADEWCLDQHHVFRPWALKPSRPTLGKGAARDEVAEDAYP